MSDKAVRSALMVARSVAKAKGGTIDRDKSLKQWFGRSQAIDAEGRPWVHYHVTRNDFSTFKPGGHDPSLSGPAIWLTPHRASQPAGHNVVERGGKFAEGSHVMPLYVKVERPLYVDDADREGKEELKRRFGSKSAGWPMTLHPDDVKAMKAAGYDGIFHQQEGWNPETGEGLETIVFDPHQVKSATGNRGTFDPADPDITKAEGGEVSDALDQFYGPTDPAFRRRYYTGTSKDKDFTAFQESRHGTWLTADPEEASKYALENDSMGHRWEGWSPVKTNRASRVIPAYVRVENPYTGELPDFALTQNYKKSQSDWFDTLRAKGYDAWVPASAKGGLLVKLTNQGTHIKSAIGNSGAYDLSKKHLAKAEGGEVGDVPNAMNVFPKPQRMLQGDDYVPGGKYLDAATGEDVTGHKASAASIAIAPGGKPSFTASRDAVDQTGSPGKGARQIKANLFRRKGRWDWVDAPEGHEDSAMLVSLVQHDKGKKQHYYSLAAHFPKGVDLARYPNEKDEPRLRPTTKGALEFGPQVGSIRTSNGHVHPVYQHIIAKADGGLVTTADDDEEPGITAYHGSPHYIGDEGFRNDRIGTGEGAQTYGHGHYFAEHEPVAIKYRDRLSPPVPRSTEMTVEAPDDLHPTQRQLIERALKAAKGDAAAAARMLDDHIYQKPDVTDEWFNHATEAVNRLRTGNVRAGWKHTEQKPTGHMYEVRIKGRPEHFLDWDLPLTEQSDHVQAAMKSLLKDDWEKAVGANFRGGDAYTLASRPMRDPFIKKIGTAEELSGLLSKAGVRGIRYLDAGSRGAGEGTRNYVVFDPKHIEIKRRYAEGGAVDDDPTVNKALELTRPNDQGFYSGAAAAILGSKQPKGPLQQMLASAQGIKPDEIRWSGVHDALGGRKVTREEIAQHFAQNMPDLEEVTLTPYGGPYGSSRYDQYTLPGGDNYKERIYRIPGPTQFTHQHWNDTAFGHPQITNPVYSTRTKEREDEYGNKILHLEELQSDWGQQGRARGFINPEETAEAEDKYHKAWADFHDYLSELKDKAKQALMDEGVPEDVAEVHADRLSEFDLVRDHGDFNKTNALKEVYFDAMSQRHAAKNKISHAPYVGTTEGWTENALKRLLTEAARGGFSHLAWTPGEEQAKRWSDMRLIHYYDKIMPKSLLKLAREHDPEAKLGQVNAAHLYRGDVYGDFFVNENHLLEADAPNSLIRSETRRDDDGELHHDYYALTPEGEILGIYGGDRRTAYLAAQEAVMEHVLSTMDEEHRDSLGRREGTLPSLEITPKMRESILKKGFKAYRRGGFV